MPVAPSASTGAPVASTARRSAPLALRAIATLALSTGAAVVVASALSSGSPGRNAAAAVTLAVPPAEAASFAVLRRPLRPGDAFTAVRPGSGPMGANPALARTLREPSGGLSAGLVSVVPANGSVCLRVPLVRGGAQWWCQTLARARSGKLLMALRPAGPLRASEQLLVGLVPDGVRSVSVTALGGRRYTLPVHDNVYDAAIYAPQRVAIAIPGAGVLRYEAP